MFPEFVVILYFVQHKTSAFYFIIIIIYNKLNYLNTVKSMTAAPFTGVYIQ